MSNPYNRDLVVTVAVAAITEVVADRITVIIIFSVVIISIIFAVIIVLAVFICKRLVVCRYLSRDK
jgi:hypothetical protein